MDRDPSMLHHEVSGKMPLAHFYHLAHDPYNETSLTIEEICNLIEEHGWDYEVEGTIKIYKRPEVEQPVVTEEVPVDQSGQQAPSTPDGETP